MFAWYENTGVSQLENILSLLIQALVRVGLPVFFVISGIFLLNEKIDNIIVFYKKRISAIIIPFLVYSFLHFLANKLQDGTSNVSDIPLTYLKNLTSSTGISVHFWFVYSMLGLYLVAPLLSLFVSKIDSSKAMFAIVFLIALKAYTLSIKPFIPFIDVPDFPVWLVYFMIGGLLHKLPEVNKHWSLFGVFSGYLLTCILGYMQLYGIKGVKINYPVYDAGLNMFIFTISLCILFKNEFFNVGDKIKKTTLWLSANTYGVYLIHVLVLQQLTKHLDTSWSAEHIVIYSLSTTSLVFIIANGAAFIINKLICDKALRIINGNSKPKTMIAKNTPN
ncbi:surface polysaccharide O-acyltransferase-like enzyme [Buttiauxella sp. JUb87]|nr:surface polysaccharide O-acyltransferase-like enzyme [Buttiauxella sp. JUb87]